MQGSYAANMSLSDGMGLAVGVSSLIVSILAIWISWKFYQMGDRAQNEASQTLTKISQATTEASERASSIGGRISELRSEAFDLIRLSFEQQRLAGPPGTLSEAAAIPPSLEEELSEQLSFHFTELRSEMLQHIQNELHSDSSAEELEAAVQQVVQGSLESVIAARRHLVRSTVLSTLADSSGQSTAGVLLANLVVDHPLSIVSDELRQMVEDGLIIAEPSVLRADTVVTSGLVPMSAAES